jgi:hypothetical protein
LLVSTEILFGKFKTDVILAREHKKKRKMEKERRKGLKS